jgi:branched-subunit amino acid aminotransferase/4-amino-4-deoxychorismate lyase
LATPPLDGTILPGVTRDSILQLTASWGEFAVTERHVTIREAKKVRACWAAAPFNQGRACRDIMSWHSVGKTTYMQFVRLHHAVRAL